MNISFEDTKTAFAYKTNKELKRAEFLFASMGKEWLVKMGLWLTPLALKFKLPVKGLIRNTIFKQFVGGETLEETAAVVKKLSQFNVHVILDYGVEGKAGEANFDKATEEFIKVVRYAATQPNIPFISVKLTGFSRFELLEKINSNLQGTDIISGKVNIEKLAPDEQQEWSKVVNRLYRICEVAQKSNVGVLIDAEESWIQNTVDVVTIQMMQSFNLVKAIIYNTVQLYRKDRLQFLKDNAELAKKDHFILGIKLVRGAYMEKERKRAAQLNVPSPINDTKEATDDEFNAALEFCIDPANKINVVIGSHNEYSNLLAVELMEKFGLPHNDPRISFSQLYGMSDNITFNLAKAGCNVSKYLPFGPIKDVIPYLMRRAQENSSVSGQTGRELALIKSELKRREIKE
jgi:proline dehydrogenase